MYGAKDTAALHYTNLLETAPPTHSIQELEDETTIKYSEDTNSQKDLVQLQEHCQQLLEQINQIGPTANPPTHIKELAHLTSKLQQLAMILQPHTTHRPVGEPLHTAIQKYTDTLFTTQWQMNLSTSLCEDIPHLMDGTPQS